MKATLPGGRLQTLNDRCSISIPGVPTMNLKILPEISDSKSAKYNDEGVIGRSAPIRTYANSDNRVISMRLHFQVTSAQDIVDNVQFLRALESLTYPRLGVDGPYLPPPVCQINCGRMLSDDALCVVLDNYQVQMPTDAVWDEVTLVPYYFFINTSWVVVYSSSNLPNQDRILSNGS